jgi:membrane associated rhomboid family serine protease
MIPFRALIRMNSFPAVTLGLIIINVLVFLFELTLSPYGHEIFQQHYALIPARPVPSTFVTSMFLHTGFLHIGGNMLYLWVFGSRIEDAIGSAKYLVFYLACGIAGALVHFLVNLGSPIPTVGASGAIAGVMGAFLLMYPRAKIDTLIIIVIFVTRMQLPASLMLIYWFGVQLVDGLFSIGNTFHQSSVAFFAHVGGFLAGMALVSLFRGPQRRMDYYYR